MGSVAKFVTMTRGYLIDVNGFDEEEFEIMCTDASFRAEVLKQCVFWAMNHPVGHGRLCRGIVFGNNVIGDESTTSLRTKMYGTLSLIEPKRWPDIPPSTTCVDDEIVKEQIKVAERAAKKKVKK